MWEQKRALARYLWERGPMTAQYSGEMSANVAKILGKALDYVTPPNKFMGARVVSEMVGDGSLVMEGHRQKPTKLTYVGLDPELIEWAPAPVTAGAIRRVNVEERLTAVEGKLAALDAALVKLGLWEAVREEVDP
jgi:hypothetical protein